MRRFGLGSRGDRYHPDMNEEFRLCGSCGRPLEDGTEFVMAEPLLPMRGIGNTDVLVAGMPQPFHPHHVPPAGHWRVLTA